MILKVNIEKHIYKKCQKKKLLDENSRAKSTLVCIYIFGLVSIGDNLCVFLTFPI